MQITYVGNFKHTFCTEVHVAASLESLGHTVVRVQEDESDIPSRDAALAGSDLLLWTRTWTECWEEPRAKGDALAWFADLRARGIPTVSYHLDLYAGLKRGGALATDPFWRTQYVFTPDGGSDAFFKEHGVAHRYLPPAVWHAECYRAEPDEDMQTDVLFVGSGHPGGGYHEEWGYRGELLMQLLVRYPGRFAKWGNSAFGGTERCPPRECIRGQGLNQLYASAKVVVGDTLCLGKGAAVAPRFQHERYWSDRVCETLGRGGLLVHPWVAGMEQHFVHGKHLLYYDYGDFAGLQTNVDMLLKDRALAERIRAEGHAEIRRRHTYLHRMAHVLSVVAHEEEEQGRGKLLQMLVETPDLEVSELHHQICRYSYCASKGTVTAAGEPT